IGDALGILLHSERDSTVTGQSRQSMEILGFLQILSFIVVTGLHVMFFVLEAILWTRPKGMAVFNLTPVQAQASAVLAANQGVYNLGLAIGLIVSLFVPSGNAVAAFILAYIAAVGIYGAFTVSIRILFLQSVPALVALALLWSRNLS